MYMRVGRGRIDAAKLDADSALVQDITEAFRQLPGYDDGSFVLGLDRATGQSINVSTYDTEEHARWTPSRPDLDARVQAVRLQADPSPPDFFEVTTSNSSSGVATLLRATRAQLSDPSKIDEAVTQIGPDLAARISGLPGCLSFTGGVDRAKGQIISISTWDTDEHGRWLAADALGDIPSRSQALGIQVEQPEYFEVTAPA
jgi:hypothetical protein